MTDTNPSTNDSVQTSPLGSRALANEAQLFCQTFRLTPRESEIVTVLAEGITRIKDIAEQLKLSPNTVNNHVNSIFMKTKARSKSQLLAMLLNRLSEELQSARFYRQSPRVLLLSKNNELSESLRRAMGKHHFQVTITQSMDEFSARLQEFTPHFALVDLAVSDIDETKICCQRNFHVVFIGNSPKVKSRCVAMNLGAIDLLDTSYSPAKVVDLMLSHYIENDSDRARFVAPAAHTKAGRQTLEVTPKMLGRGGVFLSTNDVDRVFGEPLQVGDRLDIKMTLQGSGRQVNARGEVVWIRSPNTNSVHGAGVRVLHLTSNEGFATESWRDLVSRTPSLSYIPTNEQMITL